MAEQAKLTQAEFVKKTMVSLRKDPYKGELRAPFDRSGAHTCAQ